ncbi:hypothetical protein [Kordia sp.]|uniref:hypothetical protein n=1 Tax=Kordia sp. TaxID=1965332 RepID=UPI003B5C2838
MHTKLFSILIVLSIAFSSFTTGETPERFGKDFFKLLKASPSTSETQIKQKFISLKDLKTFPKNEISEFSPEEFDEFVAYNISELQENAKGYKIAWNEIQYLKTESKAESDYGIDLKVVYLYFKHNAHTFKLQLVTIPHDNKLKLIRIMYLDFVAE